MARSEYTRLRDIAQKRLGRLREQGLAPAGVAFPKLRDLKTEAEKAAALIELRQFVEKGTTVREIKATKQAIDVSKGVIQVAPIDVIARRRKQREARQARNEALQGLTKQQRSMIKGAKTLGITIKTPDIPAFIEYMEYRFSQYSDSRFYLFSDYAEDFGKIKRKHSASSILSDFQRYLSDRNDLQSPVSSKSYSAMSFQTMWNDFIND